MDKIDRMYRRAKVCAIIAMVFAGIALVVNVLLLIAMLVTGSTG